MARGTVAAIDAHFIRELEEKTRQLSTNLNATFDSFISHTNKVFLIQKLIIRVMYMENALLSHTDLSENIIQIPDV